jgi:PleD family two-component response regulator
MGVAVDAVVRLADRRLYAAKAAGRNRVDADSFAVA